MYAKQRGFSLVELIVAMIIIGVGVAGILAVFNETVRTSADPVESKQAILVAEAMMEEVLAKSFADTGVGGGTGRSDWDDVSDYNGYSSTGVKDVYGNSIAGLGNYNVSVAAVQPAANIGGVDVAQIRQVTVTVSVGGNSYSLVGYRFNND